MRRWRARQRPRRRAAQHPDNARLEFQPKYRDLEWAADDESFAAWCEGCTGYPVVDAAMRQLARTGWMPRGLRPPRPAAYPNGTYVRRWVPALRDVPRERLPEPWTMSDAEQTAAGCVIGEDYPAPIVDHKEERERAIARYRAAGGA